MKKTKAEFFDKLEELVETGQTEQLDALMEEYTSFAQESAVPFELPTSAYSQTAFTSIERHFLESLDRLPVLSPYVLKHYCEFYRKQHNTGMMQALLKYGTDHGYTITGLYQTPEQMISDFTDVIAVARETDPRDPESMAELQSMIDQVLTPEEIVITSEN